MRPSLPSLFLVSVFLVSAAQAAAPADYYPHRPGQSWTYASGETQIIGQPVQYRGAQVYPLNHQLGNVLIRQDLMEYRPDGSVWLRGFHQGGKLTWLTEPQNIFPPGPLRIGQRWQTGNNSVQVTGVQGVKTNEGTYNAYVIATRPGGTGRPQYQYFVPTIGVVQFNTAEGTIVPLTRRK